MYCYIQHSLFFGFTGVFCVTRFVLTFIAIYMVVEGVFGPFFGLKPQEERAKDISMVRQDSAANTASSFTRHHTPPHACARALHYERGIASWYGPGFHGRQMANGRLYNMHSYTIAHRRLPLGTKVCIVNPENGRGVLATVTDRGPYVGKRIVDLSKRIADDLDITARGIGVVTIAIL
jgi:rare lipoprotein A